MSHKLCEFQFPYLKSEGISIDHYFSKEVLWNISIMRKSVKKEKKKRETLISLGNVLSTYASLLKVSNIV